MRSNLPEGWEVYSVENALDKIIDYRGRTPKKSKTGIATLSAKSVKNNYIDFEKVYYISREEYNNFMTRGFPEIGDVVLTTEAPLGLVTQLKRNNIALGQRILTFRGKKDLVSNGYLKYYFQSSLGQHELESRSTGTTVTGISQKNFRKCNIILPSLDEQKTIAATLSVLDDKIELNNKINENLEQQAQALFKHWFIDFEFPDENEKPYRSSGGEMIESELGLIPKGWEVKKLGDISVRENKSIKLPKAGLYKHFSIPAFEKDKLPILENGLSIKSNKYLINNNHILISRLNPRFKRLWRPICFGENCVCSTEFVIIKSEEYKFKNLLYSIMDSSGFYDFMLQNVTGATSSHQRISPPSILLEYKLALPKGGLLNQYIDIINVLYEKIDSNILGKQKISQLRDTLLPKLMSGQIRIPLD